MVEEVLSTTGTRVKIKESSHCLEVNGTGTVGTYVKGKEVAVAQFFHTNRYTESVPIYLILR